LGEHHKGKTAHPSCLGAPSIIVLGRRTKEGIVEEADGMVTFALHDIAINKSYYSESKVLKNRI